MQVSGGISGAITNEETEEAHKYAILEYEKIRNDKHDIDKIVQNTGFKDLQIKIIKNYLFYDKHKRIDGSEERFDPDFYIAQSWHRLAYEPHNIKEHDLILIKHESMELSLVMQGYEQNIAHNITNEKYNYTLSAEQYYYNLRLTQKRKHKETPLDWKIIKKLQKLIKEADDRENRKLNKQRGGR